MEIQKKPFHIHLNSLYHSVASLEKLPLSFGSLVLAEELLIQKAATDLSKRMLCVIMKAENLIWKLQHAKKR